MHWQFVEHGARGYLFPEWCFMFPGCFYFPSGKQKTPHPGKHVWWTWIGYFKAKTSKFQPTSNKFLAINLTETLGYYPFSSPQRGLQFVPLEPTLSYHPSSVPVEALAAGRPQGFKRWTGMPICGKTLVAQSCAQVVLWLPKVETTVVTKDCGYPVTCGTKYNLKHWKNIESRTNCLFMNLSCKTHIFWIMMSGYYIQQIVTQTKVFQGPL